MGFRESWSLGFTYQHIYIFRTISTTHDFSFRTLKNVLLSKLTTVLTDMSYMYPSFDQKHALVQQVSGTAQFYEGILRDKP